MNARFYQDIDTIVEDGISLWGALWEFAEAMWLVGHEEEVDY